MNHPEITRQNANERYARMLNDADNYRKAKKVAGVDTLTTAVRTFLSKFSHPTGQTETLETGMPA
ncbi:MAG: hypothetical protein GY805_38395 [Chloroflexi bacterium]|nr:hypothetical protein [Chloroflexota bacterium]